MRTSHQPSSVPWTVALAAAALLACQAEARTIAADEAPAASVAELDACRSEVIAALEAYRDAALGRRGREQAQRAIELFARLSVQDMRTLASACPGTVAWRVEARALADRIAAGRTGQLPLEQAPAEPFPDASYSTACGSTRADTGALLAARIALQAARTVWSAASRACDEVVVVLGEGGNASLACIAADAALYVAESAVDDIEFCDGDIDSAEIRGTYDRTAFLHGQLISVDAHLDAIDAKLDALAQAIEGLRVLGCETVRLEVTPEGQRASEVPVCSDQPGFPYDWPER